MAKIKGDYVNYENSHMEYDIMYSSESSLFWADVSKMLAGMEQYFDSIMQSKDYTQEKRMEMGLHEGHWKRAGYQKRIIGVSQKELEDNVKMFHRNFVKLETRESKVILYQFSYESKNNVKESGMRFGNRNDDVFSLEFRYYVALRKDFGSDKIYRKADGSNYQIGRHDIHKFKEIAWSQELEDFIHSFENSFDLLVTKMRPFFETDGKIIELIGKNILSQ